MTQPDKPTRAIALLHNDHDPAVYEALTRKHRLEIVYTVHTDAPAVLTALIAVQHALEHLADAVVIPHLGTLEPGTPWWVVNRSSRPHHRHTGISAGVGGHRADQGPTVITLGFTIAFGLPLAVLILAVTLPEHRGKR